ncbi:adhesion G-protein coupled receptor D2 isoform X2 [Silurus meridionalis]|nr:adhesion G-protein coupled receptor D2 isoform X2 [Silurus meridionalis]
MHLSSVLFCWIRAPERRLVRVGRSNRRAPVAQTIEEVHAVDARWVTTVLAGKGDQHNIRQLSVCLASNTVDTSSTENISTESFQEEVSERCIADSVALRNQPFVTPETVFQLVNASCNFIQAFHYCQNQFSSLTFQGMHEDEEGMRQVLAQTRMHLPVWVRESNELKSGSTQGLFKQNVVLSGLSFSGNSKDGYARVEASFPPLSAVSVCLRAQFTQHHEEVSTLFSYAAPTLTNEFQLRGCLDKTKRQVLLALIIHGKHHSYKAWFPNNGDWHQICVTWQKNDGLWNIYVDGEKRDSATAKAPSRDIYGHGIFILGQDQDSFGGNFTEPFLGNMTDLNIWNLWLAEKEIRTLFTCSDGLNPLPFFSWHKRNLTLHPVVKEISGMVQCPGLLQQKHKDQDSCRVLRDFSYGGPTYSATPCSNTHPFICKISKDRYLKKKELKESLISNPSPFMQHLMNEGLTTSDILDMPDADDTWPRVSHLLNISDYYMRESQDHLESRDVPSLLGILSRVAELPTTSGQSHATAHALGHSFISLADTLISEEVIDKWETIREPTATGGNRRRANIQQQYQYGFFYIKKTVLVFNIMFTITSLLMTISKSLYNSELQVKQKNVTESSLASEFCSFSTGPDCISVPPQSMRELYNEGFGKVTLLNAWYGSLRPLLNGKENITLLPTSTDSSFKYKGTVLGSSLISSTVMADGKFVSLGVQYTLRHQTQRTPEDERGLQILSFVGCGVSLCGLIFTFILFIAVSVPKSDRTTVHKNLIVALAAAQFLLIFSYWASANQLRVICLVKIGIRAEMIRKARYLERSLDRADTSGAEEKGGGLAIASHQLQSDTTIRSDIHTLGIFNVIKKSLRVQDSVKAVDGQSRPGFPSSLSLIDRERQEDDLQPSLAGEEGYPTRNNRLGYGSDKEGQTVQTLNDLKETLSHQFIKSDFYKQQCSRAEENSNREPNATVLVEKVETRCLLGKIRELKRRNAFECPVHKCLASSDRSSQASSTSFDLHRALEFQTKPRKRGGAVGEREHPGNKRIRAGCVCSLVLVAFRQSWQIRARINNACLTQRAFTQEAQAGVQITESLRDSAGKQEGDLAEMRTGTYRINNRMYLRFHPVVDYFPKTPHPPRAQFRLVKPAELTGSGRRNRTTLFCLTWKLPAGRVRTQQSEE